MYDASIASRGKNRAFEGRGTKHLLKTPCKKSNPLVNVAIQPPEVAETAALQKHSPGGCTIDTSPSNCERLGAYRFAA